MYHNGKQNLMYLDTEARKTCKPGNTVLQKINGIYVTAYYYKKYYIMYSILPSWFVS